MEPASKMLCLRPFGPSDLDGLYAIALASGDAGRDARRLYADGRLVGHIYAAPYAQLEPSLCIVAEDDAGVAGYVVGVADTQDWFERLEHDWWPSLRNRYDDPGPELLPHWSLDQRRAFMIHHPVPTPGWVSERYPAHVHLNLSPRLQGRGVGGRLLSEWLALVAQENVGAVHVGVNQRNERGIAFWARNAFLPLQNPNGLSSVTMWMGRG